MKEVTRAARRPLPEIEHRLDEPDGLIRDAADRAERAVLQAPQADLLDERDQHLAAAPVASYRAEPAGTFAASWVSARSDEARRAVLADALIRLVVRRGRSGRSTAAQVLARLAFEWVPPLHVDEPTETSAEPSAPTERISA